MSEPINLPIDTLQRAKNHIRQGWKTNGCICPCCGQDVVLRERHLYSGQMKSLIALYKAGDGYHHVSKLDPPPAGGGDFAKLRFWELIEQKINSDTRKRTSGMWRITEKGINFVEGKIRIPRSCHIFNKKVREWHDEDIDVIGAIKKRFNYYEVMGYLI